MMLAQHLAGRRPYGHPMPSEVVVKFWQDLKERRIAQFLLTYCAGGWIILQVADQLGQNSVLPEIAYRIVLTFVVCAFPGALIVSWFHGAKGRQTVPAIEKWLLVGVALLALAASGFVLRESVAQGNVPTGLAALTPDRDPRRVAVLYFDTRGGGEDSEFLAAGLTEALIDELSTVDALHVVSKNGSQLFRDTDAKPDSIGRTLGVGTLVEGLVAVAGERVRVSVAMVESRSGKQLESTEIERPRADLFDLQDELARQVAEFLRIEIGTEVGEIEARSRTTVVAAWEMYQRAQLSARAGDSLSAAGDSRGAARELERADSLLANAETLDPLWLGLTVERAWLAYTQARLGGFDRIHNEKWIATGIGHADNALQRAPNDARALEIRATLEYWRLLSNLSEDPQESIQRAEAWYRDAIAAQPKAAFALTSLSHLLVRKGENTEAKLKAQQSYEADPFLRNANQTLWRLFTTSWELQDDQEARSWCSEGLRRFPGDYRFRQCQLMMYALPQQPPDVSDAWAQYRDFVALSPPQVQGFNEKKGLMYMAMALVRANLPDSANAIAIRGRAGTEIDPVRELAQLEAIVRNWLGQYDAAADRLALYLTANPGTREAYRSGAEQGEVQWYLRELVDQPAFRRLVDLR